MNATNHIVLFEASPCLSSCNDGLAIKSVCANCMENGHTSHIPSLRACKTCLAEGLKCNRFLVMAVVTDCEECNKKALLALNSGQRMRPCLLEKCPLLLPCQICFTLGRVVSTARPTRPTLKVQGVTSS